MQKVIVVDAGHGGIDPGVIGIGGLKEKDINLQIAKKVKKKLEKEGYTIVMTRTKDEGLYDENTNIKKFRICRTVHLIKEKKAGYDNQHPSEQLSRCISLRSSGFLFYTFC